MGSMAFINLAGNVGSDPEIRKTNSGEVCSFRMAVNRKQGGEEFTDWYTCTTFFDRLIDIIDKYVHKGSGVIVLGEHAQRPWTDREGHERISCEVMITKLQLNDPPPRDRDDRQGHNSRHADRDEMRGRGDDRDRGRPAGRDDRGRDDRGRDDRGGGRAPAPREPDRHAGRDANGREARPNGRDDRGRDDRGRDDRGAGTRGGGQDYDTELNDKIPF